MGETPAERSPQHEAGRPKSKLVRTRSLMAASEAVEALERDLVGAGLARDAAAAEGLALAGTRAASLIAPAESPALSRGAIDALHGVSCVHHSAARPGTLLLGAFELAAATTQQAVDQTLAAHLASQWSGRPGLCVCDQPEGAGLDLVSLPGADALDALLDSAAPEAESGALALLAAALERVAEKTRRPQPLLTVAAESTAEIALVAAGAAAQTGARLAQALRETGAGCRLIQLALLRPFPYTVLREALEGARYVLLLDCDSDSLTDSVRASMPTEAHFARIPSAPAQAALSALRAALPQASPGAKAVLAQDDAPLPHRLVAAPDGPWARAATRRVLACLETPGPARSDRARGMPLGAQILSWGSSTDPAEESDLLLAADPAVLATGAAFDLLRKGSAILLASSASDPRTLARELPRIAREAVAQRGLRLYWVVPDAAGAEGPGQAASVALCAGAVALLGGVGSAAGEAACEDEAIRGWLERHGDGPNGVSAEVLREASALEEVDFRPSCDLPRLPLATPDASEREHHASWIEAFHRAGPSGVEPVPALPLRPAVLENLGAEPRPLPFALIADEASEDEASGLCARGLGELLEEALARVSGAPVLERGLESLVALASGLCAEQLSGMGLREIITRAGGELIRRLDLPADEENDARASLEAICDALPANALVMGLHTETPLRLYLEVQRAARRTARRAFDERAAGLRERLSDLLQLDRMESEEGHSPEALAASLGNSADAFFDAGALSRTLPAESGSARLENARRERIERALAEIDRHLARDASELDVLLLHPPELALPVAEDLQRAHPDPLAAAVGYYDGTARRMAALFRALRVAQLELDGRYRPELHDAALADLDWQGFDAGELALVPQIAVVTTGERLRRRGQSSLSELLRSSRPVHVLVQDEVGAVDEAEDLSVFHVDLGYLMMAHREVFAVSSTLARPDGLVRGLARMARALRPGVALVRLPSRELGGLRPLLAEAALQGRAQPDFVYDPDAGTSWANRFDLSGNPDPDRAWPLRTLAVATLAESGDQREETEQETLDLAFTFADAVALEPAYRAHLRLIPSGAWDDALQQPLALYLERFDPERHEHLLPYIWLVDEEGVLQRAVVSRELALACLDRLRGWRVVQELAGFENAYAERAAATAREQALAEAEALRVELEAAHAEELSHARGDGARESMQKLATVLLQPGAPAAGSLLGAAGGAVTPAPSAPRESAAAADETSSEPVAAAAQSAAEEDDLVLADPYIDSALCTSCNDCTTLNNRLFHYNGDKQAEIADASAGTFAELVQAAEKCPAHCIHPGKPRDGDGTATPELVERASKLA